MHCRASYVPDCVTHNYKWSWSLIGSILTLKFEWNTIEGISLRAISKASMGRSCRLSFRNRADGSSYDVSVRLRAGQTADDVKQYAQSIAGGPITAYYSGDELITENGIVLLANAWRSKCTEDDLEMDRGSFTVEGEDLILHIAVLLLRYLISLLILTPFLVELGDKALRLNYASRCSAEEDLPSNFFINPLRR